VLYEQKIKVQNEQSGAARASAVAGGALGASAAEVGVSVAPQVPIARGETLEEAAASARAEVKAEMSSANRTREAVVATISHNRDEQLQMPWPPRHPPRMRTSSFSRPGYGGPSVAPAAPILDSLADLSGRRDPRRSILPRRPRRGFVRGEAVISAPLYVTHMYADPPTPPPPGSVGSAGYSDGYEDGDENVAAGDDECNDYTDGEGAPGDDSVPVGGAIGDIRSGVGPASSTVGLSGASLGEAVGANNVQEAPAPMLSRGAVAMHGRSYPLFSGASLQQSPSSSRNAVSTAAVADGVSQVGGSGMSSRHAAMHAGHTGLVSSAGAGPAVSSGLAWTGGGLSSPSHSRKRVAPERDTNDGSSAGAPAVRGTETPADALAELFAA